MLWGWKAQIFQIRREEVLKNERVCYMSNTHLFNLRELRLEGCLASKYWPSLSHNLPTKNLWIGSFDNVTLPRCQHLEYSILPQEVPYERGKFISLILSQTFGRLFAEDKHCFTHLTFILLPFLIMFCLRILPQKIFPFMQRQYLRLGYKDKVVYRPPKRVLSNQ